MKPKRILLWFRLFFWVFVLYAVIAGKLFWHWLRQPWRIEIPRGQS